MTPEDELDRRAQEAYEAYQIEKSQFIHDAQTHVWNLWINRLVASGNRQAIARTRQIVKEWTGHVCMVTFPSESTDDIPF